MNKKAIALLGGIFLLIAGTLGFLIYAKRGASPADPATVAVDKTSADPAASAGDGSDQPSEPVDGAPVPSSASGKLTDDQVVSPVLTYAGTGISYINSQGQLFRADIQQSDGHILLGNKKEITIAIRSGIANVLWPPTGNNFIAQSESNGKRSWTFFDASQNVYKDLPPQINSLAWLPDGMHILYTWLSADTGRASLNVSNADGTGYHKISDIFDGDSEIVPSPDGRTILFYRRNNSDSGTNKIILTTPDGKVFKSLISEGFNSGVLWAPDSQRFLFGRRDTDSQRTQLWLGDLTGSVKSLGMTTSIEKAVWSRDGKTVVVAVPNSGSADSSLTEDALYRIDVYTDERTQVDISSGIDARNLFLNLSADTVFFKNMQDGLLYYASLNQ